eukprot:gnl/TRDRNA2_/TRDRNA2_204379_c0_seq1.p1 gnl/TRDRNA2_/TRDRNA2_204379_c0~~gnl/TRDRNA2_/TRDRNA2_204379_c0_seq1.p1  ORF type:complete len:203 (-),score=38.94 gnl/TRDRNA2_/TRDRNA2_204379_c0_seq1:114-722(-)
MAACYRERRLPLAEPLCREPVHCTARLPRKVVVLQSVVISLGVAVLVALWHCRNASSIEYLEGEDVAMKGNGADAYIDKAPPKDRGAPWLRLVLEHGADVKSKVGEEAVWWCCTNENVEGLRKLLELGAELKSKGPPQEAALEALTKAAEKQNVALLRLLLEHGVDAKPKLPAFKRTGSLAMLKLLAEHGYDALPASTPAPS